MQLAQAMLSLGHFHDSTAVNVTRESLRFQASGNSGYVVVHYQTRFTR